MFCHKSQTKLRTDKDRHDSAIQPIVAHCTCASKREKQQTIIQSFVVHMLIVLSPLKKLTLQLHSTKQHFTAG